jgi:hypothetical protein
MACDPGFPEGARSVLVPGIPRGARDLLGTGKRWVAGWHEAGEGGVPIIAFYWDRRGLWSSVLAG